MFIPHIYPTYDEMSKAAAQIIADQVRKKPDSVLGLATGSTPLGMYQELIRIHKEEGLSFAKVTTINLDEYVGLAPDHPQSYHYFMWENLFNYLDIPKDQIHILNGLAKDLEAEAEAYDQLTVQYPMDIQVLGIGENGHIAFNEPGAFIAPTHVVELTESTIQANSRFFDKAEDVPRRALTMGLRGIMSAKEIILLASGPKKAKAVRSFISAPMSMDTPASILQVHPKVYVFADEEAAKLYSRGKRHEEESLASFMED